MVLKPHNVFTNAMSAAGRLAYHYNFEMPWLDKKTVVEYIKSIHGPYAKVNKRIEQRIKDYRERFKGLHSTYEPTRKWLRDVAEIPQRDIYIFLTLESGPLAYESGKFEDFPPKFFKDPLDTTKKSTHMFRCLLEELGIAEKSYLVFLDEVYQPFPIMPEKYSEANDREKNLLALPEILREHYTEHVVISPVIRDIGKSIERMKNIARAKINEGWEPSERDERMFSDLASFKRDLTTDLRFVEAFSDVQLMHFCEKQGIANKFAYLVGSKEFIGWYERALSGINYEEIIPFEDVSENNQRVRIVKQGSITSDRTISSLRNRIEKTYLRSNPKKGYFAKCVA
jgi:hypothetical protein